ncbi:hypothetical protein C8F04DRAFT_1173196 [Mycena alexandri]|uniref:Uncharacterized protein n=1 Tax=Mycena alexandri TaxID=1745969 RepID=A0AAD6TGQ2_9AGAR|nr:hypothetical protein C8F04DRAFT_1270871 [Mycena alexandri]KAJ7046246.1 hypothetical protein C8F04DRAFT_1173196 [Mycena alexandri]
MAERSNNERRGLTINLPCTLRMDGPQIANTVDQDSYRLSMAHKIQLSRAAEARVFNLLIEETKLTLARCQAEIELAKVRAEEERLRLEYYQQMNEAAENNLLDADMQIGVVRHQIWGKRAEQAKMAECLEGAPKADGIYSAPLSSFWSLYFTDEATQAIIKE